MDTRSPQTVDQLEFGVGLLPAHTLFVAYSPLAVHTHRRQLYIDKRPPWDRCWLPARLIRVPFVLCLVQTHGDYTT